MTFDHKSMLSAGLFFAVLCAAFATQAFGARVWTGPGLEIPEISEPAPLSAPSALDPARFGEFLAFARAHGNRQGDWEEDGSMPPRFVLQRHGPILEREMHASEADYNRDLRELGREAVISKYGSECRAHAGVVTCVTSRHAVELMFELIGRLDEGSGGFIPVKAEFSRMELAYCDFIYRDPADHRFQRRTAELSLTGSLLKAISYTVTYAPSANNGQCMGEEEPPTVTQEDLPLDDGTARSFAPEIVEWMEAAGI